MSTTNLHEIVGAVVRQCLTEGSTSSSMASARSDTLSRTRVRACRGPRVFISYVREDYAAASQSVSSAEAGGSPPVARRGKIVPRAELAGLRRTCHRYLRFLHRLLLCRNRCAKRGQFPYEVRYALRTADRMPLDDVFILPVRLAECAVPVPRIAWHVQYGRLFPDWDAGVAVRWSRQFERMGEPPG